MIKHNSHSHHHIKSSFQVHQLAVNYDKTPVLWDISLQVPEGKIVGIIGPNGAGKSTFIKASLGLIRTISGKVEFFSKQLNEVRRRVAYVPQRESVDWDFPITVRDLVLMGRYGALGICRWPRKADLMAVDHYLELVGLTPYVNRQISQLSGGQQQRLCIARTIATAPEVILMDEPCSALDPIATLKVEELIHELKRDYTIVIVTHNMQQAQRVADRTAFFLLGDLVEVAVTEDLFENPTDSRTEEYVSGKFG